MYTECKCDGLTSIVRQLNESLLQDRVVFYQKNTTHSLPFHPSRGVILFIGMTPQRR